MDLVVVSKLFCQPYKTWRNSSVEKQELAAFITNGWVNGCSLYDAIVHKY